MEESVKHGLKKLRDPFPPHQIGKLAKGSKAQTQCPQNEKKKCAICGGFHHPGMIHLDYVGHAALTDRLLDADSLWTWEPFALKDGLPAFDASGGLWIKLTVCGHTRLGYGNAEPSQYKEVGAREKEVIGDALRNAAMRFGAALELWHKGDLHGLEEDEEEGAMERDKNKDKPPLKEPRPKASESTDFPATDKQKRMVWAKLKKVYGDDEKARGFCIESTNKASSKDWTNADVQNILNQLDAMPEIPVDEEKPLPPQEEKDLILDTLRSLATEPEHVDAMCLEGIGKNATDDWTAEDVDKMREYIGIFEKTKETQ